MSSQTQQHTGLTGTGCGLAPQEAAGPVFGRVWNRTEPYFLSKPGLLAGYLDRFRTLTMNDGFGTCY